MILNLYVWAALLGLANGVAVLLVNPRRIINQIYFLGTIITGIWYLSLYMTISIGNSIPEIEKNEKMLFWLRMSSVTPAFIVWQIAIMQHVLADGIRDVWQALKTSWPWLAVSCSLAALAFSELFIPSHSTRATEIRGSGYAAYMLLITLVASWLLGTSARRIQRSSGIKKLELQLFVSHALLASLCVIASTILSRTFPSLEWLRRIGPAWITLWQGSIVWAICNYKVFDGRQVVTLVGQRLLLLGFASGIGIGLHALIHASLGATPSLVISLAIAAGSAVFFDPLMRRLFKLDTEYQLSVPRSMIISWSRESLDENNLIQRMQNMLRDWCKTDHVSLWSPGTELQPDLRLPATTWRGWAPLSREGWITPEALQRQKASPGSMECLLFLEQENLGALLAVPIGSSKPSLLIGLGRKQSLRPYTYPDIQMLLTLAELMDNVLTHSRISARLTELDKMEAAAMMSRSLAHDLNNLATPVSSFLLHMESRVQAGTTEAEVLGDAKHSLRVMQDYIRESLFFARRLVPDFRPVAVGALLDSTLKVTQARASARDVAVRTGDTPDLAFEADAALLQRLLQNLVFNGIDATPQGGTVTLSVAPIGSDRIRFSVADEGPGVPPELVEKIFEPYFTTKDTGDKIRGLGLGLAVSQKIATLHGGSIHVGRSPTGGALFSVLLPLKPVAVS